MIRIDAAPKLDYSQVMMVPRLSADGPASRNDVNLDNDDGIIPIIAANMDGVGTFAMAEELAKQGLMTALHKHYSAAELIEFYIERLAQAEVPMVLYSLGINQQDLDKWDTVYSQLTKGSFHLPTLCVDVANGYTKEVAKAIKWLKDSYPVKIMAGNVVTREGVYHLADAGADIVKIGVGPGSVCTTRRLTGIGYPQFSAVVECVEAAKSYANWVGKFIVPRQIKIVADGGITCPGDAAKAFAAGADYVMIGGMFAGHDEGFPPQNIPEGYSGNLLSIARRDGKVPFYGMASATAQNKHNGGVAEYRASEGKEVQVPYRGPVRYTVNNLLGGLRSACAYLGCRNLKDISDDVQFIQVANQTNNVFGVS